MDALSIVIIAALGIWTVFAIIKIRKNHKEGKYCSSCNSCSKNCPMKNQADKNKAKSK